MAPNRTWTLVILPNLLFLMNQAFPKTERKKFDEGYFAQDQQVWIRYENSSSHRFSGVWANSLGQKNIRGMRQGSSFVFQVGSFWWKAELLKSPTHCEPTLELSSVTNREKNIQLRANYCVRDEKRNKFF